MTRVKINKVCVSIIIMMVILIISTVVNADYSVGMSLTSNSKLKAGDTVVVNINLASIDAGEGIRVIEGNLKYDKNIFEVLSSEDFTSTTGWSAQYGSQTDNVVITNNAKVKTAGAVCTITFKVKSTVTDASTTIKLNDIVVSGGTVENGGTGDITVSSCSVTINKAAEANNEQGTVIKNTTKVDNTVNTKSVLPKTGVEGIGVIAIVAVAIIGIGSFIIYKKMEKEVK